MIKRFLSLVLLISAICFVYAGDVAMFEDIGFSADGKTYLFAQYGITDKTFQGYAEIYAVDIEKNDFVPSGIYKIKPTSATFGKNGVAIYEQLKEKNKTWLSSWTTSPSSLKNTIYLRKTDNKTGTEKIIVKDFERSSKDNSVSYSFNLVPFYDLNSNTVASSFYILVEKKDASGNVLSSVTVGNPDVKRKNITGYTIEKILCDDTGTSFVIVVEKRSDEDGTPNIRYMVETFVLK